jgi:NO-binding membrane sensor protein with MHYT domain
LVAVLRLCLLKKTIATEAIAKIEITEATAFWVCELSIKLVGSLFGGVCVGVGVAAGGVGLKDI